MVIKLSVTLIVCAASAAFGQNTSYQYDVLNRLTRVIYADNTTISYSYDAAGNRLSQVITNATTTQPPSIAIDSPTPGATISGITTISGWTLDNATAVGTAISNVQILVDGAVVGTATYGSFRGDACGAYPGRPGCPNVGFTYALNANNLSSGNHTITVSATDSDSPPATGSLSVNVVVSSPGMPPTVHIDSPSPGTLVSGITTISGWAIDNASAVGTAISKVQVLVDGAVVGTATYGSSRGDVCGAYPGRPGCPNVGFTYALDTNNLGSGNHTVTVSATDTDSTPATGTTSVNVVVSAPTNPPTVHIDSPSPGTVVSGITTISGWALDNASAVGTAISKVQVLVDGTAVGSATYGSFRGDVCGAFPGRPGCPNVGLTYALDTSNLSPGNHTVTVSATDSDSPPATSTASVSVVVPAPTNPPTVHIDSPSPGTVVSGITTISGWALDNASAVGTAISKVQVLVDGAVVGAATYGVFRGDVCGAFPGRPGCPNVGFTYALDTNNLSPGNHTITVSATDTDSTPATGTTSVSVVVSAPTNPPTVHIDSPSPGTVVSGITTISGWALDNASAVGTAISKVQVLVDGAVVGAATYGVFRGDVCGAFPGRPGCPNVGLTYALDTSNLSPGNHTVTVSATDSDSPPATSTTSVSVVVAPHAVLPTVHIDSPSPGSVISGTTTISGWALDNSSAVGTAINKVQILIDGTPFALASYGSSRLDVCAAFPGRSGCPNVGFTFALNTNNLSPGTHTITASATDSDPTPDTGTDSVTVTVSTSAGPSIVIESPVSGANASGEMTITGWVIDKPQTVRRAIAKVQVSVDDVLVGTAAYGISRPDICDQYPGRVRCPNVGFNYRLNTAPLAAGPHVISVSAIGNGPTSDAATAIATFIVTGAPSNVTIDSPVPNSVVSGTVTLSGWAIDNASESGTAIQSLQVMVDGIVAGNATYGITRPDVCDTYRGQSRCPNVGYQYQLDTSALSAGAHVISVSAAGSNGAQVSSPISVMVTVADTAPTVFIDAPTAGSTISGIVPVRGWVLDNGASDGTPGSTTLVKIDGVAVGTATYGIRRFDVCSANPDGSNCPNVGYTYELDTARLSPGMHTLTVVAGGTDEVADSSAWSVTINVTALPRVKIDIPSSGATVSGTAIIEGWAMDSLSPIRNAITSVQVNVDGVPAGVATYGVTRADVCKALPYRSNCPNVGFIYTLDTSTLANGQHTISVVATDSNGHSDSGSDQLVVTVQH